MFIEVGLNGLGAGIWGGKMLLEHRNFSSEGISILGQNRRRWDLAELQMRKLVL